MKPSNHLEHAWLNEEPPRLYPSLHHPSGAERRFNEAAVRELVTRWQSDREPKVLDQILSAAEPVLKGTILSRNGCTPDFEETLNGLRIKLWRKLHAFNPERGRIFTFVSMLASQGLAEDWARRNLRAHGYPAASIGVLDCQQYSPSNGHDHAAALDDLRWRIMQTRTICTDPHELESQRWLVKGLLDAEFKLRRHEAADAMSIVYGLRPSRARVLHDQTLLEVRRQLLDVVQIPKIDISRLCGTRGHALARYADQLSAQDFSNLAYLMKNLAPTIIPRPERIDLILAGFPNARPLFG